MLTQVIEHPTNRNLLLEYYDRNTLAPRQEEFDLVVLAAGMQPADSVSTLVRKLGLECKRYGFVAPDLEEPAHTMPDPDLVIRTSGEIRVSNFLLWQSAYAEYVFTDVLWPDFGKPEFLHALEEFSRRHRRYGLTGEQAGSPPAR